VFYTWAFQTIGDRGLSKRGVLYRGEANRGVPNKGVTNRGQGPVKAGGDGNRAVSFLLYMQGKSPFI
jgi:hypothetical protein